MPFIIIAILLSTTAAMASEPSFTCNADDDAVTCGVWVTPDPADPTGPGGYYVVGVDPTLDDLWHPIGTVSGAWDGECQTGGGAEIRVRESGVVEVKAADWAHTGCELYAGDNAGGVWTRQIYVGDLGGSF